MNRTRKQMSVICMQTYMKEWKKGKPERNGREGPLLFCKELTTMAVKTVRRLGKNISNVAKEMGANHRTNERQCKGTPPTVYVSTKSGFFCFCILSPLILLSPRLFPCFWRLCWLEVLREQENIQVVLENTNVRF